MKYALIGYVLVGVAIFLFAICDETRMKLRNRNRHPINFEEILKIVIIWPIFCTFLGMLLFDDYVAPVPGVRTVTEFFGKLMNF